MRQLLRNPPVLRVICLLSTLRPFVIFICILVGSAVFIPVRLLAQTPTAEEDVLRVSTELFLFPVRIRDKRGQAVPGLTENDLTLKDKDKITTGLYFSAGVD
ncbi:MAG: hypothetical protein ACRD8U_07495, partial [Pyrinomonadaceae bacterium]